MSFQPRTTHTPVFGHRRYKAMAEVGKSKLTTHFLRHARVSAQSHPCTPHRPTQNHHPSPGITTNPLILQRDGVRCEPVALNNLVQEVWGSTIQCVLAPPPVFYTTLFKKPYTYILLPCVSTCNSPPFQVHPTLQFHRHTIMAIMSSSSKHGGKAALKWQLVALNWFILQRRVSKRVSNTITTHCGSSSRCLQLKKGYVPHCNLQTRKCP